MLLSRMNIRERLAKMNKINIKVEAVFTKSSRFKNRITVIIKPDVKSMETHGVPYLDILLKETGKSSSFPIAIGLRDAVKTPAFPVEIKAKSAAKPIVKKPNRPRKASPPSEIGVRVFGSSTGSTTPIVTKITRT